MLSGRKKEAASPSEYTVEFCGHHILEDNAVQVHWRMGDAIRSLYQVSPCLQDLDNVPNLKSLSRPQEPEI
jgi:hypothetical protein